jgi:hypothetical protein
VASFTFPVPVATVFSREIPRWGIITANREGGYKKVALTNGEQGEVPCKKSIRIIYTYSVKLFMIYVVIMGFELLT